VIALLLRDALRVCSGRPRPVCGAGSLSPTVERSAPAQLACRIVRTNRRYVLHAHQQVLIIPSCSWRFGHIGVRSGHERGVCGIAAPVTGNGVEQAGTSSKGARGGEMNVRSSAVPKSDRPWAASGDHRGAQQRRGGQHSPGGDRRGGRLRRVRGGRGQCPSPGWIDGNRRGRRQPGRQGSTAGSAEIPTALRRGIRLGAAVGHLAVRAAPAVTRRRSAGLDPTSRQQRPTTKPPP